MKIGRIPGIGAAAALAVSTLAVFGTFQNYGPESAVRRFHHAVANDDHKELEQVVSGSPDTSAARELEARLKAILANSVKYGIVKSERSPTQVEMLAVYDNKKTIVWVVVKARDRWRIDAYLTLQALQRLGYQ